MFTPTMIPLGSKYNFSVFGAAPRQIRAFNKALLKAMGCVVLTILGSPDPWDNGKIATYGSVYSYHL